MDNKVTLANIFVKNKDKLAVLLEGLKLPQDSVKVQEVVTDFLSSFFEYDGEYRQSLTQSEDYILQAAIQVLNCQQEITKEIASKLAEDDATAPAQTSNSQNIFAPIAGAGIGAAAGSIAAGYIAAPILGGGVIVLGAIAGTAVAIYLAKTIRKEENNNVNDTLEQQPLDPNVFIQILQKICNRLDVLIETYRVQVQRVIGSYEQREKPTLQSDYRILLDQIVNLNRAVEQTNEPLPAKVTDAVKHLIESLENYDLRIENGKIINCN